MSTTMRKNARGQHIMAPQVGVTQERVNVEMAEKYLKEAGWTEQSRDHNGNSFWADPAGMGERKGRKVKAIELPVKDGADPVVIQQTCVPPAPWNHPLSEAVNIQRARDQASAPMNPASGATEEKSAMLKK